MIIIIMVIMISIKNPFSPEATASKQADHKKILIIKIIKQIKQITAKGQSIKSRKIRLHSLIKVSFKRRFKRDH